MRNTYQQENSKGMSKQYTSNFTWPSRYIQRSTWLKSEIFFLHQRLKLVLRPSGEDEVLVTEVGTVVAGCDPVLHIEILWPGNSSSVIQRNRWTSV